MIVLKLILIVGHIRASQAQIQYQEQKLMPKHTNEELVPEFLSEHELKPDEFDVDWHLN